MASIMSENIDDGGLQNEQQETYSHKGIIIGKKGSMLKKIGTNARYEMEKMLDAKVNLKLWVKVKKDWRDSDFLIKNFGYREEE